jgi:hypothetical protein
VCVFVTYGYIEHIVPSREKTQEEEEEDETAASKQRRREETFIL